MTMRSDGREYMTAADFQHVVRGGTAPDGLAVLKSCGLAKAIDRSRRTIDFVLSDGQIDREQDAIAIDGWQLDEYRANPVVLFSHDHRQPPVAKALDVAIRADALRARDEFTTPELYPFGDLIFRLYAEGFMRAVSVGFVPHEWTHAEDRKYGLNYLRQSLIEHSCVPVPAHPGALVDARSKGIDLTPLTQWAEATLDGSVRDVVRRGPVERLWAESNARTLMSLAGLDAPRAVTQGREIRAAVADLRRAVSAFAASIEGNEAAVVLDEPTAPSDEAGTAHVFVLDDEVDLAAIDAESMRALIRRAAEEELMARTGLVDFGGGE
jgi:phage head maturation protease